MLGAEPHARPAGPARPRRPPRGPGPRALRALPASPVDPDAVVEDLPVGVQQRVEILKALSRDARVLDPRRADRGADPAGDRGPVRDHARAARRRGKSVVFITHKLKEVKAIADRITVIRRGAVVGTRAADAARERAGRADGRPRRCSSPSTRARPHPGDAGLAAARPDRRSTSAARPSSTASTWRYDGGEIVAIAGVQGNGQSELVEAHARPAHAGPPATSRVGGMSRRRRSPAAGARRRRRLHPRGPRARRAGRRVLRRREPGPRPLPTGRRTAMAAAATSARSQRNAEQRVEEFDIRTDVLDALGRVALRRQPAEGGAGPRAVSRPLTPVHRLAADPRPRRRLDRVRPQADRAERDQGTAVLIVSSELDEVLALADRIAVMYRGRIVAVVAAATRPRERIGLLMAGGDAPTRRRLMATADRRGRRRSRGHAAHRTPSGGLGRRFVDDITTGSSWVVTLLAIVVALVLGASADRRVRPRRAHEVRLLLPAPQRRAVERVERHLVVLQGVVRGLGRQPARGQPGRQRQRLRGRRSSTRSPRR